MEVPLVRFALCLAAFLAGASTQSFGQELRVATGEYPPFTASTEEDGGIINRTVRELADAAEFSVSFDYLPWKRGLELTRMGRYEAASFWYFSEDRQEDFIHVGPILQDRLVFFYLEESSVHEWSELTDLSSFRIGAVTGYTLTSEFWNLADEDVLDVHLAPDDTANLRKLLAGRIDLYPISEEAGWDLIRQTFSEEDQARFRTLEKPLVVSDAYLLISRAIENAEGIAAALQSAVSDSQSG